MHQRARASPRSVKHPLDTCVPGISAVELVLDNPRQHPPSGRHPTCHAPPLVEMCQAPPLDTSVSGRSSSISTWGVPCTSVSRDGARSTIPGETRHSQPAPGCHQLDTGVSGSSAVELVLDNPRSPLPGYPSHPPGSVKHQLDTSVPRTSAVELVLDHPRDQSPRLGESSSILYPSGSSTKARMLAPCSMGPASRTTLPPLALICSQALYTSFTSIAMWP